MKTEKDLISYFSDLKSRVKYKNKRKANHVGRVIKVSFGGVKGFVKWYNVRMIYQNHECHYCHVKEGTVSRIVTMGLLKSERFREKSGRVKQGIARGYHFELDRKKGKGNYSKANCVLVCYFCSNDKSDIFNEAQYFKFLKDRKGFLESLLK